MPDRTITLAVGLILAAVVSACGGDPVALARERAVGYFERDVRKADASWASLFGYLHRRFGLEVRMAGGHLLHLATETGDERDDFFRRLEDPLAGVPAERVAEIRSETDRMTALALHCDRLGVPPNWLEVLGHATKVGGYALTHAALATRWTSENGCRTAAEMAPLEAAQSEALAQYADARDALERSYETGTDLWIESLVMLYYLDAGDRVRADVVRSLLDAQRPDGGWPLSARSTKSHPHATALALWVLLENEKPGTPRISWIVSASD